MVPVNLANNSTYKNVDSETCSGNIPEYCQSPVCNKYADDVNAMTRLDEASHAVPREFLNSSNLLNIESRVVSPTFNHSASEAIVAIQRLANPYYMPETIIDISSQSNKNLLSVEKQSNSSSCGTGRLSEPCLHTLERFITSPSLIQIGCSLTDGLNALNSQNILSLNSTICTNMSAVSAENCLPKHSPSTSTKSQKCVKISNSVEKRNARERTRVHTVNQAFGLLKNYLPSIKANTKRVSKLKILRAAVNYIYSLDRLLGSNTNSDFLKFISKYEDNKRKTDHPKTNDAPLNAELPRCRTPSPAADNVVDIGNEDYVPSAEAALMQHLNATGMTLSPRVSSSSFEPFESSSAGVLRSCAPLLSTTGLLAFNECASLFGDPSRNFATNPLAAVNFLPAELFMGSIAFPSITNFARMSQSQYF